MYYFNYRLMESLPGLLGTTKGGLAKEIGITHVTLARWNKGEIPCSALAKLCNLYRISLSSFLVIRENPEVTKCKPDYVFSQGLWSDVEWDSFPIGTLFGPGSRTGVTRKEAAEHLGFSSGQIFDRWASTPDSLRINDFLRVLNEYKIDASLFFKDTNAPIALPAWKIGEKHIADIVSERMKNYKELEVALSEAVSENRSLRLTNERLARENRLLRERKEIGKSASSASGLVRESSISYGNPFEDRGYVFHMDLWEKMYEIADMTKEEFCKAIGIDYRNSYTWKNVTIDTVVRACNMFHVSISHFFLPKSEVPVVHDAGYYIISPRLFIPIEDNMDNMKYLFGRYSATGFSTRDLNWQGIWHTRMSGMSKKGGTARVLTLCDICTTFNIPPYIFFKDENRKKAAYSQSLNERLILNSIEIEKELKALRLEIKRLKNKTD